MPPARPPADRFADKVLKQPNGCWLWSGSHNAKGYAYFYPSHRETVLAHRWAWEQVHGTVPGGQQLDHVVCDNTGCVNPAHVALATSRANTLRSRSTVAGRNARATHCPQGHAYDATNTVYRKGGRWRACRTCKNAAARRARRTDDG